MKKDTRRRIVIGDVHGCVEELRELLLKCDYRGPLKDRLIFVGDLVDKGPDSKGVVGLVLDMRAESVLGNHDEKHLRWNRWNRKIADGKATKNPMKHNGHYWDFSDHEWAFFDDMPLFSEISPWWYVVHAGFECTGRPFETMDPNVMLRIRDVHPSTGKYHQPPRAGERRPGAVRWPIAWQENRGVIYGHAPFYEVRVDGNGLGGVCIGLDTGCVHGGYLTAMVLESEKAFEFVQVRAKEKYADPFNTEEDYVQNAIAYGS